MRTLTTTQTGNVMTCLTCLCDTAETDDMFVLRLWTDSEGLQRIKGMPAVTPDNLEAVLAGSKKVHHLGRVVKSVDERRTGLTFAALDCLLHDSQQGGNKQLRPRLQAFVTKFGGEADSPLYLGLIDAINTWLGGSSLDSTISWLMSS